MDNQTNVQHAVKAVLTDGVICYPTEAVFGLGCHPLSANAFQRIINIKKRPMEKGVILVASNFTQLAPYVIINDTLKEKLNTLWPGFVTCLLPKHPDSPDYLNGQFDTIAVRISTHPTVRALCQATNSALVSTSANLSGTPPCTCIEKAKSTFIEGVDVFVDAPLGEEAKPSRIVHFIDNHIHIIRD